jgi:FkbM family methyltransferase
MLLSLVALVARTLPMSIKRAFYRIPPLAGFIRNVLNRAAPGEISPVTVAAGELQGIRLNLDLQSEKDYWLGTYEPELQRAIADLVEPGMVAYDVGANIGYISLILARRVGPEGRVFAFEALPRNLSRLLDNLTTSSLAERVRVIPAAVVEQCRRVEFLVGPSGGMGKVDGSAGRRDVSYESIIHVEGISLDDFVFENDNPSPQVIKMDIEGGEVMALPGMRRLLNQIRPILYLELHGSQSAEVAWDLLLKAGYRICHMQAGYPHITSQETLSWKAYVVAFPAD